MSKCMLVKSNQGECVMCGKLGKITFHHIIPKRLKIKGTDKCTLVYDVREKDKTYKKRRRVDFPVQDITIPVCDICHKVLHPENWRYNMVKNVLTYKYNEGTQFVDTR